MVGNFCQRFPFASQEPFAKIKSAKILLSTCKANGARFNPGLLGTICIAANRGALASVPLTAIAEAIQEIEMLYVSTDGMNQTAAQGRESGSYEGPGYEASFPAALEQRDNFFFLNCDSRHSLSF